MKGRKSLFQREDPKKNIWTHLKCKNSLLPIQLNETTYEVISILLKLLASCFGAALSTGVYIINCKTLHGVIIICNNDKIIDKSHVKNGKYDDKIDNYNSV